MTVFLSDPAAFTNSEKFGTKALTILVSDLAVMAMKSTAAVSNDSAKIIQRHRFTLEYSEKLSLPRPERMCHEGDLELPLVE